MTKQQFESTGCSTFNPVLEVESLWKQMVDIRRHLHRFPELGFEEKQTARYLLDQLSPLPLTIRHPVAKTGIVATLKNGPGPTIALRADMDALSLVEETSTPYRSTVPGVMHACGHDGHMAILVGTAHALHRTRDSWQGSVRFIFQPAEEGLAGALKMIQEGALETPKPQAIFGLHLWNQQRLGTIGVKPGPVMASSDRFDIQVKGRGGHGAMPQSTVDASYLCSQLVVAIQSIVSRNVDPLAPAVISIGRIDVGSAFNVIAERGILSGTTRAYDEETRSLLRKRLAQICAGMSTAFNADIQLRYQDGYPPTINDLAMSDIVASAAASVVGEKNVAPPWMSMGGEDMAYYLQRLPGCFFFIGSLPENAEVDTIPHHSPNFDFDERALCLGASTFVQIVRRILPVPCEGA